MAEYDRSTQKAAIIAATLAAFLTPFMGSSINVAIPSIGKELGLDAVQLGWVASAYLLSTSIFLLPFGKAADIYGRRRIFLIGLFIYTISALLCGFSQNGIMIIMLRVVQGIGGSMIFGTAMAIITSVVPPGERGKILGINVATVYLGLSLGPFIGGMLTYNFGWRSVFFINAPLGSIAIYYTMAKMKGEWAEARGEKLDYSGSVVYGISLAAMMVGVSKLPQLYAYVLIGVGLMGIALFIFRQSKILNPLMNIKLFKGNPAFTFSNIAALINYAATFAITFLLSLYLQYIKLKTPQQAGFILVAQPLVMAIFSPVAGHFSDKIGSRTLASLGMGIAVIGLIMLALLTENTSISYVVLCLVVLGFGFALFSSPNTNAVMSAIEKKYYGIGSAILSTMRVIGQMTSMAIAMLVISVVIGNVRIKPEYHTGLMTAERIIFLIFVILCSLGIFASLARGKQSNKQ